MSEQLQEHDIFVGREKETALFEQMLDAPLGDCWIIDLHGEGGIGKTFILRHFAEIGRKRGNTLLTAELVDLYWTANQQELGLFKSIALQVAPRNFQPFFQALEKYQQLLDQKEPDPQLVQEKAAKAREQFIAGYRQLAADRIILLFDTVEIETEGTKRFWLEILPELKKANPRTLVVIAGHRRLELERIRRAEIKYLPIVGFSKQDIAEFFRQRHLSLPKGVEDRLLELSRGRPILVALAADWIQSGRAPQDLVACERAEFEKRMVERILQLRSPQDMVILAMAHLYRRFNEQILAYVLSQKLEQASDHISHLKGLSFVKYRVALDGKASSCTLHDEMRALVVKYVWPLVDPLGDYRRTWNTKIIDYYAERITSEFDRLEKQNLGLERLFYWLAADFKDAFEYSRVLFQEAIDKYDIPFMEAIQGEVEARIRINEQEADFTASMKCEHQFRESMISLRRGRYADAIRSLTKLLDTPECEEELRVSVQARLVEACAFGGGLPKAVEYGEQGKERIEKLLCTVPSTSPECRSIERDFGWLCNCLGIAYRLQNKLDKTVENYIEALRHFEAAGNAYSQIANTKNNLGYVYHSLGRDDEALAECDSALRERISLGSADQLGYSYAVLGTIRLDQGKGHDAIEYFDRALEQFRLAESERGEALVWVSYARLMRQWGLLEEKRSATPPNPDREQYLKSEEMLSSAIAVFERMNDLSSLSEAWNERGTLRRQQGQCGAAIECFKKSLALSKKIGNEYRRIDNEQDIAITYCLAGNWGRALRYANVAMSRATKIDAPYLHIRAQRTVANVYFKRREYDIAFETAADALVSFIKLDLEERVIDPKKRRHGPAKRDAFQDEWMKWLSEELVLNLPSHDLVRAKCDYLLDRWAREEAHGNKLADLYPGFVTRVHDLVRDYPLQIEQRNRSSR